MPIRVILLEPETGGNIGSIARSMRNFNLNDLWIVKPKTSLTAQAVAFAMRGREILRSAATVRTLGMALRGVDLVVGTSSVSARSTSNLSRHSITPARLAEKVRASKGRVALVFGRESSGLSNKEVESCDCMVTIPSSPDYNVLNVATAASIIFYEIFQQPVSAQGIELATKRVKSQLQRQFSELVKCSGIKEHKRKLTMRAFQNVVSRSFISKREASLLVGVFRKANAKFV